MEQHGSVGSLRPSAVARVGQAVNMAVERFVTVGETIADDYPEVRQGMYEACKEARQAGNKKQKQTIKSNVRARADCNSHCELFLLLLEAKRSQSSTAPGLVLHIIDVHLLLALKPTPAKLCYYT